VADAAPPGLSLRLNCSGLRQTRIEDNRLPSILRAEGIDLRQCLVRIERLRGTGGIFGRHKRDGAAAEKARERPSRSRRRRQQREHGNHDAPL
jgi:hypothetical protein